ncbi:alpha-L-arabinofuranosidase C-terminal domain-containing protein [Pelagicoccus albus]|uniref:non-reducing end alpha-L-arabinofuranosidase n=1 Tax=Pelagicoccus albus TaxID=415222 RepID=A0A7X1E7G2_9BACT|nr:alpha-L-arabinofuranosidase C-terminal domain-containing protein [Pelagicoccus albus]MBC2605103.1 alpha-N-arabinofuranosidase [Pelagicoccus albus]
MKLSSTLLMASMALNNGFSASSPETNDLTVHLDQPAKPISSNLWGIFYEDLNYAADGGLYAEMIQNRSFDFSALEQPDWNALSFWEVSLEGDASARLIVDAGRPLHRNNPTYGVFKVDNASGKAAIRNPGFDGISVEEGKSYNVSAFARLLHIGPRWTPAKPEEKAPELIARIVAQNGDIIAESKLPPLTTDWSKLKTSLVAQKTDTHASFELVATEAGGIALDIVSLFPADTFRGRENGLRKDIAQTIADLHPRFIRFPGGCLVHGNGVENFYDWKDSVGPLETRKGQPNLWGYHQSVGLGYFEYFQFCEDIGAIPVPVVAAAVSCQHTGQTFDIGQSCLPIEEMERYIQDTLDLIEWANGPADSKWGSLRAAAGHPEPFGLKYVGVGNEDKMTPEFEERFKLINDAIQNAHPEITVIGTVGPFPDGEDFEIGWSIANELQLEVVDEHYYRDPDWFWDNLDRYDSYDRSESKVYLGEYAAHDEGRRLTLRSALAEAAFMTSLERNGDVVIMASYAPLLAKIGRTQWNPDLIYFDNQTVYPTISYEVQKLFGETRGDEYLQAEIPTLEQRFAASAVRNSESGNAFVKLVNGADNPIPVTLNFASDSKLAKQVKVTTLAGELDDTNTAEKPGTVLPSTQTQKLKKASLPLELPPYSLVIVELAPAD